MNFTWCGQSCGSTSRAFIHEKIHDAVIEKREGAITQWRPGIPTDPATTMGAIISKAQFDRVMGYIDSAKSEGARLVTGGGRPTDPALAKGFYIEPTVFADVKPDDEDRARGNLRAGRRRVQVERRSHDVEQVNAVEYGLTASIWTNDLGTAHRAAADVQAGFIWINDVSKHFLGDAVRRLQAIRHRPGGMLGGDARLHAGKEHPREA